MDTILPKYYKEYGRYINSFRSFPLDLDGLKPVERRVLLTAYLVANNKLVKSARIDGTCTARFHPHGSSYGTIVQMVKQNFLIGQGNFGVNLGVEPMPAAAMRYTECELPETTKKLCFEHIKHVPWISSDLDDEPQFLPTMFPLCLLGNDYTIGIGFGFRTYIPCYSLKDLYKRLQWLLGIRKTKPTIKPISDCTILSDNTTLEELLTTGKAKIEVKGVVNIIKTTCKAKIKSWPPGRRFESFLNKFKQELDNGDIGFIDSSNEEVGTEIVFSVLKQRNRDKIFAAFLKKLDTVLRGSIPFEIITVDTTENIRVASVDEMLINTYNMYTEVNKTMLKHKMNKVNDQITELQALEVIRPTLSTVLRNGGLTKANLDVKIKEIADGSSLPEEVVKMLITKYRIQRLLTVSTDTRELTSEAQAIQGHLGNLQEFVIKQYGELK